MKRNHVNHHGGMGEWVNYLSKPIKGLLIAMYTVYKEGHSREVVLTLCHGKLNLFLLFEGQIKQVTPKGRHNREHLLENIDFTRPLTPRFRQ